MRIVIVGGHAQLGLRPRRLTAAEGADRAHPARDVPRDDVAETATTGRLQQ